MLRSIRSGLNSFFVLALLGLLIASFAIWGIGDQVSGVGAQNAAEVEGADIPLQQYYRAFQIRVQNLQEQFGTTIDTQQAISFGLHQQVLQEMIQQTAYNQHALKFGLTASDEQVAEAIREIPALHDADGNFSRFLYGQLLNSNGLTADGFEKTVRRDIARQQYLASLGAARPVPELMLGTLYEFYGESRAADLITVPLSAVGEIEAPADAVLQAYFEDHQNQFLTPEYRSISVAAITPEDLMPEIAVTEEDVQAEYDNRRALYIIPETRTVEHIVFPSAEEAQTFTNRVRAGELFGDVVQDMTEFSGTDVSLGDVTQDDIDDDFNAEAAAAVFALELGSVTDPVQGQFGWDVFQVTKVTAGSTQTFEDVRQTIRREVARERAIDSLFDIAEQAQDVIASGASLSEVAEATGIPAVTVEKVGRDGLDPEGRLVNVTPNILPYLQAAFTFTPETELDLLETGNDGYYMVQVHTIFEQEPRSFAEAQTDVLNRWRAEERGRRAREKAQAIVESLQDGAAAAALATAAGGTLNQQPDIRRGNLPGSQPSGLSQELIDLVFSLDVGEAGMREAADRSGYVVAITTAVNRAADRQDPQVLQQLKTALGRNIANDIMVQYQTAMNARIRLQINDAAIRTLFNLDDQP